MQYDLKRAVGRHVQLTMDVQDELKAWHKLVRSLAISPTHLHELEPFPQHGLELPIYLGQEWDEYAETQRDNTLFGVPPLPSQPRHVWCLPPTLQEM